MSERVKEGVERKRVKSTGIAGVCTRKCKLFSLTIKPLFAAFATARSETEKDEQVVSRKKGSGGWKAEGRNYKWNEDEADGRRRGRRRGKGRKKKTTTQRA